MFNHKLQAIEVKSDWISCKLGVLTTMLLGFEIYKFCFLIFQCRIPYIPLMGAKPINGAIDILIRVQERRIFFYIHTRITIYKQNYLWWIFAENIVLKVYRRHFQNVVRKSNRDFGAYKTWSREEFSMWWLYSVNLLLLLLNAILWEISGCLLREGGWFVLWVLFSLEGVKFGKSLTDCASQTSS